MRFEPIDQYIEQQSRYMEKLKELREKEQVALQELETLKSEYEQVMTESVTTGKDVTEKLDELCDKVESAERVYKRRQQEHRIFFAIDRDVATTCEQIAQKFNGEFRLAYREEVIQPILDRLLSAKREVTAASMAYNEAIRHFEDERYHVRSQIGENSRTMLFGVDNLGMDERQKYFITDRDIRYIRLGEVLPDVKLEMGGKE